MAAVIVVAAALISQSTAVSISRSFLGSLPVDCSPSPAPVSPPPAPSPAPPPSRLQSPSRSDVLGLLAIAKGNDSMALFEDVTSIALPKEWYTWSHSGYPRSHQGTPTFVDINKDGVLDYLYHNHYEADPRDGWDVGVSYGTNTRNASRAFFYSVGHNLLRNSEPEDSKWKQEASMDTHGTAVIDIDRDGLLDIYMAVGGGDGHVAGPSKNAVLMWGEKQTEGSLQGFRGGRDASEYANIHNPDSRGRFNYWADFNKDGLLDVVFSNEPREDDINAPGFMMLNRGDRTFEAHKELLEYTETMIMTDADGDGHAEEFVVQRRDCTPKQCKYKSDLMCKSLQDSDLDWYNFCTDRPEDTTAIFKWNADESKLVNIAPEKHSTVLGASEHPMSMQTGDFDGDQKVDLVVLHPSGISFYYSSKRQQGELPIGKPSAKIEWSKDDCAGNALRVADLDLDGKAELLVLCSDVTPERGPVHRLYKYDNDAWELLDNKALLGDLRESTKVHPTLTQMEEACHNVTDDMPVYLHKGCVEYNGGEPAGNYKRPRSMGLSVVDWNNDGFLDVAVAYDFGRMLMLRNSYGDHSPEAGKNHYLAIKLVGTESNEYGVGATVFLKVRNLASDGKESVLLREVNTVSHETDWLGTHDDRLIFGLGSHGVPVSVTVHWPNKQKSAQTFDNEEELKYRMDSMRNLLVITETHD